MSEEFEVEAIGIEVTSQPIELYKVLKIANAVSGGGEAKMAISEGYVAVNGDVETRKRCKVYDGDVIQFNGEFYLVLCDAPVEEAPLITPTKAETQSKSKTSAKSSNNKGEKRAPANKKSPNKAKTKAKTKTKDVKKEQAPSTQVDKQTGRREIKF